MSNVGREMTLDEWMGRLPPNHRAFKELVTLREKLQAAETELHMLREFRKTFPPLVDGPIARKMVEDRARAETEMDIQRLRAKLDLSDTRKRQISNHVCGLQGFDPMRGDRCSGCDERWRESR